MKNKILIDVQFFIHFGIVINSKNYTNSNKYLGLSNEFAYVYTRLYPEISHPEKNVCTLRQDNSSKHTNTEHSFLLEASLFTCVYKLIYNSL